MGAVQHGGRVARPHPERVRVGADALVLHLNPLQEAIQPEGQRNFAGLLGKIATVAREIGVPVIVKEVGCGISREVAEELLLAGVRIVDTAGSGGTSWARIEAARADDAEKGERFADWGIPTPVAIRRLRDLSGLTIIGSGGIRNGVDAAKAIASGADLVGVAHRFLQAADRSSWMWKRSMPCLRCVAVSIRWTPDRGYPLKRPMA